MKSGTDVPDDLVDQIYEAAFVPELWSGVLDRLSAMTGSVGGAVLTASDRHPPRWAASEVVAPALHAFATGDAWKHNKRPERWLSAAHPGFLRDVDLFTDQELRDDQMSRELQTNGLGWQLGAVIPMSSGDVVVFSLERRFVDGAHDVAMRDAADPFRPHLARAGLLAARLGLERARNAVATLEAIGLPAAVTTASGHVLAANGLLDQSQILLPTAHGGLALPDARANELLRTAISTTAAGLSISRSIPMAAALDRPPVVIHVLPLSGAAHDIFSGAAIMLIVTTIGISVNAPDLSLLRSLFDLSPAEAKLAAGLSSGRTLKQAADDAGIRISTARSYLEGIFRKTGAHQQSQLVALLKSTQALIAPDRK
jgi:DNA-binding CsgD family transcriptional regulator